MTTTPDNVPYREPTSALSFGDLLLEVSREMGVAYYGENGDEEPQIPVNVHDLFECKRHVNNGLRMFFADAPPAGWRFARPIFTIDLFGDVNVSAAVTSTAIKDSGVTVVTVTGGNTFCQSMELHLMTITTVGDVMITKVLSPTRAEVDLNGNSLWTGQTFSILTEGVFTLPPFFAGMITGSPSYAADSNEGVTVSWVNEAKIRKWRENVTDETGDPFWLAVRPMFTDALGNDMRRRRWELLAYPKPNDTQVIEFPVELHFDLLVNLGDSPPVPYIHDETIKEACLAVVERDVYDKPGRHWENYHSKMLAASHQLDARMGPRSLGYFGNPATGPVRSIRNWRAYYYDRPEVTVS